MYRQVRPASSDASSPVSLRVEAFGQVQVLTHQNPVPQAHRPGDGQQQEEMGLAGGHALVPPLPEPVEADAQQTGNRPPAKPALLLEPLQTLREVRRKDPVEGLIDLPLPSP